MKIKLLSPVHIGTGKESSLSPYGDYVYQGGYVYYIDHDKLENWILSQKNYMEIMENYISGIKERQALKEFFNRYKLDVENYSIHKIPIFGDPKKEKISRTIANAGLPYIPGSSIKGAIRTAILWKIQKEKGNMDAVVREYLGKKGKHAYTYIGEDIFGRYDKDVMKFLQVTDTEVFSRDDLEIRNIKRVSITRPNQQMPAWVEVINSDKEVSFEIKPKAKEKNMKYFRTPEVATFLSEKTGLSSILKALNEFSKEIIQFELNALRKPYFKPIISFYKNLMKEINNLKEKEAILRIGYGKTFFDNTIDLLFKDDKKTMDKIKEMTSRNPRYRVGYSRATGRPVSPFPITRWLYLDANGNAEGVLGWIKIKEE